MVVNIYIHIGTILLTLNLQGGLIPKKIEIASYVYNASRESIADIEWSSTKHLSKYRRTQEIVISKLLNCAFCDIVISREYSA